MKHLRTFAEFGEGVGVDLTPGQVEALEAFESLLVSRAVPLGIIAVSDRSRIRERHLFDSLRAAPAIGDEASSCCDIGSGAGLPGIVLAIALPHLAVVLCEIRRKRVAFLEMAVDELGLGPRVAVEAAPVADLPGGSCEVCTTRAFASPEKSWDVARRLLLPSGRLIYFAGRGFAELPAGTQDTVRMELLECPLLESAGPLAIMSRK